MAKTKESTARNKYVYNKHLEVAKKMPPLYHKIPGDKFDVMKSEVVNWLIKQPDILQFLMDRVANRSESTRLIKYDSDTGKWQGVDYDGD